MRLARDTVMVYEACVNIDVIKFCTCNVTFKVCKLLSRIIVVKGVNLSKVCN